MYHITLATDLERHQRDASSILFSLNTSGFRAMKNEQGNKTLNILFALLPGSLLLYLTNKSILYIYTYFLCVRVYVQLVLCTMFLICFFLSFSSKSHFFPNGTAHLTILSFIYLLFPIPQIVTISLKTQNSFLRLKRTHAHTHQAHLSSFSID